MLYLRSALNGEVDYTIIFRKNKKKNHRNKKHTKKPQQTSCGICNFPNSSNSQIAASVLFPDFTSSSLVSQCYGWQTSLALKLFTPPTDGFWHWFRSTQNGWMDVDANYLRKIASNREYSLHPLSKMEGKRHVLSRDKNVFGRLCFSLNEL